MATVRFWHRRTRFLSISARLEKLRHVLRLLSPETDWTWLLVINKRISAKAVPRPKGPRYQDILKLDMLGFQLMDDAWSLIIEEQPIRLNTALAFRDGLLIAITAATSLRRRNLAQMIVDQHLIQTGDRWHVSLGRRIARRSHLRSDLRADKSSIRTSHQSTHVPRRGGDLNLRAHSHECSGCRGSPGAQGSQAYTEALHPRRRSGSSEAACPRSPKEGPLTFEFYSRRLAADEHLSNPR